MYTFYGILKQVTDRLFRVATWKCFMKGPKLGFSVGIRTRRFHAVTLANTQNFEKMSLLLHKNPVLCPFPFRGSTEGHYPQPKITVLLNISHIVQV